MTSAEKPGDLLDTVRSTLFASVPALGVLVFLIVAVKVFRAAHMETATTVAVVSSADPVALLKGVVLTLLPGFLTAVVAAGIWWWVGDTPSGPQALDPAATARTALFRPRTLLVWSLLVMAFFTISWPVFLVLAVPVIAHTILLTGQSIGRWQDAGLARTLPSTVRATGLIAAVVSVGWLALSPTVWLPLRLVHLDARHTTATQGMPLPTEFGAFILSRNKEGTTLLMDSPRAVVELPAGAVSDNPPLCVPQRSPLRKFFLRASQVVHLDPDQGTPYITCPHQ